MNALMVNMIAFVAGVKERFASEKGATAVEYGIMVALIAVVIIGAVGILGGHLNTAFTDIAGKVAPKAVPAG
ncbi:pilus assembly protein Flp/PilA [Pseudarthrobacter sp. PvP004]|uniref:Flp family type IVb pilin n=1 Tax=Pseudarthrobacter sp. PvP004 TaxID=2817850 RepID=UPI001AEACCAC|nr:Flp family type IVb pilin [Pseudarthrobacter sp. PvP004]MBP2269284.1 pilus assembly protein Flp/PilA [Pseudarthrobacter sp. PvP004]